ncbi:PAS domain S-box-containing protein/diguanylate cyclase (GGDEF) domain-containing protein [Nakamurella panacisegetis]|uniref:PAS domain S-box-containing protein/diguanylate cyclase (GGDEF) domain-containing protein n=1 Tax=Nakamurella panacisegetis TaxID=1090615 RepID=A0A1H0RG54_9ACTN|nr:PAS domain S-box-containing protein/diguanylate cyclase (GGDEF) domain-containing protein [Nakamurella panacisegetis]
MVQDSLSAVLGRRSSDVALIANPDTEITFISPSVVDVLSFTQEQLVGVEGLGLVHRDDLHGAESFVTRVLSSPGTVERMTFRITNAYDEWRWIEETLTNCIDVPGVEGLVANVRDVTNEVEARSALTASERRYRTIVETAQEGVLVLDSGSRILVANHKAAEMLGHKRSQLFRKKLTSFVDGTTKEELRRKVRSREARGHERFEMTYPHPDGRNRIFQIVASPLSLDADGAAGSLAMISDVTDARLLETELRHLALHDALTGLPNRALLADRLSMALSRQELTPNRPGVAVLSINVDGFKLINDVHGHEFGDAMLAEVAHRLSSAARPGDNVTRTGGDEFLVVAEGIRAEGALALAEHLRKTLLEPMAAFGVTVYVDASVGVAVGPGLSSSCLLRSADDALRRAKARGRGRVHVHDPAGDMDTGRRLQVANAVRRALDCDELTLGYQPIVDLTDGHVVGVEALLRWVHPELGPISPPEIVAIAHSIGLAERLDECVLARACTDMTELRERSAGAHLKLSVNLSAQSFEGAKLLQMVIDAARLAGWPLGQLTLELTEGVLMSDTEAAATVLARLGELNVSVAFDDFGTGYSLDLARPIEVCLDLPRRPDIPTEHELVRPIEHEHPRPPARASIGARVNDRATCPRLEHRLGDRRHQQVVLGRLELAEPLGEQREGLRLSERNSHRPQHSRARNPTRHYDSRAWTQRASSTGPGPPEDHKRSPHPTGPLFLVDRLLAAETH